MEELTEMFAALSDKTRLRILKLLDKGELCVCDIVAALDLSQPKVSFHLNVLKKVALLKGRKQGKWMHYRIDESEFFKRLILLSILDRISETDVKEDKERLEDFLKRKNEDIVDNTGRRSCCN